MSITQHQIAKQLGISQRSVSVAFGGAGRISEKRRQEILQAAGELGYRRNQLASSLRRGQSGSVGVLWAFVNPWTGDSQIGIGVLNRLQQRGLVTYQAHHGNDQAVDLLCQHLDELMGRRVDALVLQGTPGELMDDEVLERIGDVPTIAVCREDLPEFPGDLVIHDRNRAINEVVDHLVDAGRRKIGMALAIEQESNPSKLATFLERLRFHGLEPHDHELIKLDYPDAPGTEGERHAAAMQRVFPGEIDLDAIFCFNDIGAMYVMQNLRQRGLEVPEDIAVVGFNNTEPGKVWSPPLASGDRCFEQVADAVDRLLAHRMADPSLAPQRELVHMRFVPRASAGSNEPA